jgi:hypothetical protein
MTKNDIIDVVKVLKTKDKKYDPDGEKPFFMTWIRNNVKNYSKENINKTSRYFGKDNEKMCRNHNISSRWSDTLQDKSMDFLDKSKVESEIKKLL